MKIINRKQIIIIEPDSNNKTRLFIHLKNTIEIVNVNDVDKVLPALRSRILGNGYEVLMDTVMPENEENKHKLYQFIAQEIQQDGKIPPMNIEGMDELAEYAQRIARKLDNQSGYTLRLRILSGIIRAAGDQAMLGESKFITKEHVQKGIKESIS